MKTRTKVANRVFWNAYSHDSDTRQQVEDTLHGLAQNSLEPPACILDAGCGTGVYTLALAQAGFKATGVDFSANVIEQAQTKAKELKLAAVFEQMNLDRELWYADASFDCAICISLLHLLGAPNAMLNELSRIIKPGGLLVIKLWQNEAEQHETNSKSSNILLQAVKTLSKKTKKARYWSVDELQKLVTHHNFEIVSIEDKPLITLIARRSKT